MAKNYIQDVAKMLDVELGEEFNVSGCGQTLYKLTEDGLSCLVCDKWEQQADFAFMSLIKGKYKIIKLPWQPKDGDVYYRPRDYHTAFSEAVTDFWRGTVNDFALKEAGMIFKTKAECEAALPELRKKYLGGDKNV